MDSFVQEIKANAGDQARASLALAVLGEAGLRLGPNFPLPPMLFLDQFSNEFDKVSLSAAVALGRAGAGNVPVYVPAILRSMQKTGNTQYLLLQSIKEVLQQAALLSSDIGEFSTMIWDQILAATGSEDNKAVCAECIGRMVIIDPKSYMPKLQVLLLASAPVFSTKHTDSPHSRLFLKMIRKYCGPSLSRLFVIPSRMRTRSSMRCSRII